MLLLVVVCCVFDGCCCLLFVDFVWCSCLLGVFVICWLPIVATCSLLSVLIVVCCCLLSVCLLMFVGRCCLLLRVVRVQLLFVSCVAFFLKLVV